MSTNKRSSINISGAQRPVDVYFNRYNQKFTALAHQWQLGVALLLLYFSAMGLVWIIPFPHLGWLGSYNGYFSWASFFIAGLMFYWYKQSPVISYFLLLILFAFSFLASRLLDAQLHGGPAVWMICAPLLVITLIVLLLLTKKRGLNQVNAVFNLPLWLIYLPIKRLKVRY